MWKYFFFTTLCLLLQCRNEVKPTIQKHIKRKPPIGPTGLLRKRPVVYASEIEASRSGTWSPNRFSLFVRLARSWLFLFSLDPNKTWMFLSSNLVNINRARSGMSWGMQINWAATHITLTPHLIWKQTALFVPQLVLFFLSIEESLMFVLDLLIQPWARFLKRYKLLFQTGYFLLLFCIFCLPIIAQAHTKIHKWMHLYRGKDIIRRLYLTFLLPYLVFALLIFSWRRFCSCSDCLSLFRARK